MATSSEQLTLSCSRNFPEWLSQQRISLALSTYQTSRLLLLGLHPGGALSGFERLFDRAMGLYASPDAQRLYLATRYQIWRLDSTPETPIPEGYDRLYVPRAGFTTGDLDIHDIAVEADGRVVFVATGINALATLSERYSCEVLWLPPFISRVAREDRCHLNGLALRDGKARYATAVSRSDAVDGWRERRQEGGVVLDVVHDTVLAAGLSMPHSPRWYQGRLWLLNSGQGEFGHLDVTSGKFVPVAFCPGYPRGLAFHGDYAFVGLSKARDATFSGLALSGRLAAKDTEARCGVMVIDLRTGDSLHWVRLDGVVTELFDVQILPETRRAYALGFKKEDELAQYVTFAPPAPRPVPALLAPTTPPPPITQPAALALVSALDRVPPEVPPPVALPPAVPLEAGKKRIVFSLSGDKPEHVHGALANARLAPQFYPGWVCRFYLTGSVPAALLAQLQEFPYVEVLTLPTDRTTAVQVWQFAAAADPEAAVTIFRSVEARLNKREQIAVQAWLRSGKPVHIMRDHPLHTWKIPAGLWGVRGGVLPWLPAWLEAYGPAPGGIDAAQDFLDGRIYPQVKDAALLHDEFIAHQPFPGTRRDATDYVGRCYDAQEQGDARADARFRQFLQLRNKLGEVNAYFEMGKEASKQKEFGIAAQFFLRVTELKPEWAPGWHNYAKALQEDTRREAAVAAYEQALRCNNNLAPTHSNLGTLYQARGDFAGAEARFRHAIKLDAKYVFAHYNLAQLLHKHNRTPEAIGLLQAAVQVQPDYFEAFILLGEMLEYALRIPEALQAYLQASRLRPEDPQSRHYLGLIRLKLCDWQHYDQTVQQLRDYVDKLTDKEPNPLRSIGAFPLSPAQHGKVARFMGEGFDQYGAKHRPALNFHPAPATASKRLRIGYLSPDYRAHAVGKLVRDLFAAHDRAQVEVWAYSLMDFEDDYTRVIRAGCDQFRVLTGQSSEASARQIYADQIDILVDLCGYNAHAQPEILALRPAPVQAMFLGHPNTMGGKFLDYILVDPVLVHPEDEGYYTEAPVYLPHAFLASAMPVGVPKSRTDYGLPEEGFIFCCFNAYYKLEPRLFGLWMNLLRQVPRSVLWLGAGPEPAQENLRKQAAQQGVSPQRLIFCPFVPEADYLARYTVADLFLDTFVYGAGSTGACALYAGLPLLGYAGHTNAARMGASLCAAAGLPELICTSAAEYAQKAVQLASQPHQLRALRQRLQSRTAPLFDVPGFARTLERAYVQLWARHAAGESPRPLYINPDQASDPLPASSGPLPP